ncbi:HAD family hydrolase [Pelobacter propionicus]|uniref:phosphoglycolate phosphatase n=1 Tax=Pelobacter propionicus (strain DSM 2379 / NBRC 103807 / OttBd1) TaxID=338966 RepID=A1AT60_PELPD|nr:HAD family hydrolase [Pelobacter propionicus]ABL00531.1 HAD-superfamily hydrolase, subfamily IA, variant 3 [Pelobacter propionicus DSM 2379]
MNQPKSRYKVVIYDCDGVMFDSLESNYVFYNRVMAHLGRPPLDRSDEEARTVLHTYSFSDVMEYFFTNDPARDDALAFAKTIRYRELAPYMRMEEGLMETLDRIRPHVSLAICTNRASSMEMIIEDFGLNGYFSCIMTASQVTYPKPHPEPLLRVLDHFGIQAGEALFVGDAEVDRRAAVGAGVPFVAYKSELPATTRICHHQEIVSHLF